MKKYILPIMILILTPILFWFLSPAIENFPPVAGQSVFILWTPFVRVFFSFVLLLAALVSWLWLILQSKTRRNLLFIYFIFLCGVFGLGLFRAAAIKRLDATLGDSKIFILSTWEETQYNPFSGSLTRTYRDIYTCNPFFCTGETIVQLLSVSSATQFRLEYDSENKRIQLLNVATGEVAYVAGSNQENNQIPENLEVISRDNAIELSPLMVMDWSGLIDLLWLDEQRLLVFDGRAVRSVDFSQNPVEVEIVYSNEAEPYNLASRLMFMPNQEIMLHQPESSAMVNVFTGERLPHTAYPYLGMGGFPYEQGFLTTFANGNAGLSILGMDDGERLMVSYLGEIRETMLPKRTGYRSAVGSHDGNHLLVMSSWLEDSHVYLLDGQNLETLMDISLTGQYWGIGMNEAATLLFVCRDIFSSDTEPFTVQLEVRTLESSSQLLTSLEVNTIPLDSTMRVYGAIHRIGLSHDEKLLAVGTETGLVIYGVPED